MDEYRVCGESSLPGTHSACALYELGDLATPREQFPDCALSELLTEAEAAVRLLQLVVIHHLERHSRGMRPSQLSADVAVAKGGGEPQQESLAMLLNDWSNHLRSLDGHRCIHIEPRAYVKACTANWRFEERSALGTHQDTSDHSKALGKTGLTSSFAWSRKPTEGGAALLACGPDGRYPESVLEAEQAITFSLNRCHRGANLVVVNPHEEGGSYYVAFLGCGGTWHRSVGDCVGSRCICYTGEAVVRASQLEIRAAADGVSRACWSEDERKSARGMALHDSADGTCMSAFSLGPSDVISVDVFRAGERRGLSAFITLPMQSYPLLNHNS